MKIESRNDQQQLFPARAATYIGYAARFDDVIT